MVSILDRKQVVDPAVAEMLQDLEKKNRIAKLPRPEQNKARKDAARHKVGLDLPPSLHDALQRIAEKEKISLSGLVTFYLYRGVVNHGVDCEALSPYKRSSRSPRFEYVLDFTELEKTK